MDVAVKEIRIVILKIAKEVYATLVQEQDSSVHQAGSAVQVTHVKATFVNKEIFYFKRELNNSRDFFIHLFTFYSTTTFISTSAVLCFNSAK